MSQPYSLSQRDLAELEAQRTLRVEIASDSWYLHGTLFVGVWVR